MIVFYPKKGTFTHLNIEGGSENWLNITNVTCLAEDEDGFIWASTWGSGIIKFHPDHNSFEHFTPEENDPRA